MILKWLRQRKLEELEAQLAGRRAALQQLHRNGWTNYGIAEQIAVLEYQINKLKEKQCK